MSTLHAREKCDIMNNHLPPLLILLLINLNAPRQFANFPSISDVDGQQE